MVLLNECWWRIFSGGKTAHLVTIFLPTRTMDRLQGRRTDDFVSSRGGVLMARAGRALLHEIVVCWTSRQISRSNHAKMRKDREVSERCERRTSCRRIKQVLGLYFLEEKQKKKHSVGQKIHLWNCRLIESHGPICRSGLVASSRRPLGDHCRPAWCLGY